MKQPASLCCLFRFHSHQFPMNFPFHPPLHSPSLLLQLLDLDEVPMTSRRKRRAAAGMHVGNERMKTKHNCMGWPGKGNVGEGGKGSSWEIGGSGSERDSKVPRQKMYRDVGIAEQENRQGSWHKTVQYTTPLHIFLIIHVLCGKICKMGWTVLCHHPCLFSCPTFVSVLQANRRAYYTCSYIGRHMCLIMSDFGIIAIAYLAGIDMRLQHFNAWYRAFCLGTEVPRHSAGCVGTYVPTWYVRRFSQCARASAACMLYTLNRMSNVFIACK